MRNLLTAVAVGVFVLLGATGAARASHRSCDNGYSLRGYSTSGSGSGYYTAPTYQYYAQPRYYTRPSYDYGYYGSGLHIGFGYGHGYYGYGSHGYGGHGYGGHGYYGHGYGGHGYGGHGYYGHGYGGHGYGGHGYGGHGYGGHGGGHGHH